MSDVNELIKLPYLNQQTVSKTVAFLVRLIHHKFNINKYPGTVWGFLDIYFAINPIYYNNTALRNMPFRAWFHFHFVSVKKYKSVVNALNLISFKVSFLFSLFLLSNMSSAFYINNTVSFSFCIRQKIQIKS